MVLIIGVVVGDGDAAWLHAAYAVTAQVEPALALEHELAAALLADKSHQIGIRHAVERQLGSPGLVAGGHLLQQGGPGLGAVPQAGLGLGKVQIGLRRP